MSDPFAKVSPGSPFRFPARTYNALMDLPKDVAALKKQGAGDVLASSHNSTIVTVKNTSGAAVGWYGVLGIDTTLFTPTESLDGFKNQIILKGITPTTAAHTGKFVVLLQPLANGAIGKAVLSGAVQVQVNVSSSGDTFADVKNSDATQLQSGSAGSAQILYKQSGTGTKWAIVQMAGASKSTTFAKITGNSQDGSNKRWIYSWSEVEKTSAGYGGWTVKSGGLFGSPSANAAYNETENMNGASGQYGNGVTSTNLTGTFNILAAPTNLIVELRRVVVGTTTEYWFSYSNGIDGAC